MDNIKKFFKSPITINILIITAIAVLYYGIIIAKNGILYDVNDDLAMKSIASGAYMDEPSLNLIFSGFPFSFGLVALYILFPRIDWYGTTLLLSLFFYTIVTIYFLTKNIKETYKRIASILVLFCMFSLLLPSICTFLTFTKIAGFVIGCCLILYLLPENNIFKNIIIALGILLSYGIRAKACLMLLVFFLPAFIYKNWKNKDALKKDFIFGAIVFACLFVCFFADKFIIYHGSSWKEFFEYNEYRSLYYDYYLPEITKLPREKQIKLYSEVGLNGDQIFMLENYAIGLDTSIPEKLPEIIKACKAHNIYPSSNMKDSLNKLIVDNLSGKIYLFTLLAIICLSIENKSKKEDIIKIVPFFAFQILILLYLAREGRIVERVYGPLYFGYIATNIIILSKFDKVTDLYDRMLNISRLLIISVSVLFILYYTTKTLITDAGRALYKSKEWMSDYFQAHQENLYLFNRENSEYYYLFNKYTFNNIINFGGWTAYSPVYNQKIKNRGASSLKELVFKDNVYFITNNQTDINLYKFLDDNMTIEYIDQVNEYMIYKFRK